MLCLHGYNLTAEIHRYMLREFEQYYKDVMDFYYVDGPHECQEEPGDYFVSKGHPGPYRSWLKFEAWKLGKSDDDEEKQAPNVIFGLEDSTNVILDMMRKHGPFDGIIGFSQGSIIFRHFYRLTQDIDPQAFDIPCEMPKFIISFSGPLFKTSKITYKGQLYAQDDYKYSVESIHIYGEKDIYLEALIESEYYNKNPVIVKHSDGHKIPKDFTEEHRQIINDFIKDKYVKKYGSEEGFKVQEINQKL
eukprot:403375457